MASRSFGRWTCIVMLLAGTGACASRTNEPSLDEVRQIAERYRDVNVAKAEGYTTDNKCTTAEMLGFPREMGAMGLHYVRRDLLGLPPKPAPPGSGRVHGTGTHTDFRKPAMLVYEPQPDGSLQLVAVENLVFASAWEASGKKEQPTFHGQPYVLLVDKPETKVDEAHGWEPHYELHAWVFRDNPNGMHAEFSPRVTCRYNRPPQAQPATMKGH
jgi:hypothetical protein